MTTTKRFTPQEALLHLQELLPVADIELNEGLTVIRYTDGTMQALANAPIDWVERSPIVGSYADDYRESVTKTIQCWEVERQDRISLVGEAVEFIGVLNSRYFAEAQSSIPKDVEYSQVEQKTYESALKLLQREFENGSTKSESHLIRSEVDVTTD